MAAYRLVWFQHLHKAAGTYIIRRALANDEKFYDKHENGNPCDENGVIPLWEMNANELTSFIDGCEQKGVTFVAIEWGSPDFSVLANDPRVSLLTCLRDPLKRLISNYNYDHYWMWTKATNYSEYLSEGHVHSSPEYYTRVFSRKYDSSQEVGPLDLEVAKTNIALFDNVIIAESGMEILEELGWSIESDTIHPTFGSKMRALHLLKKLRFKRLWNYLRKIKHLPPEDYDFKGENQFDIAIYENLKKN